MVFSCFGYSLSEIQEVVGLHEYDSKGDKQGQKFETCKHLWNSLNHPLIIPLRPQT